jgi:hypothetical protein
MAAKPGCHPRNRGACGRCLSPPAVGWKLLLRRVAAINCLATCPIYTNWEGGNLGTGIDQLRAIAGCDMGETVTWGEYVSQYGRISTNVVVLLHKEGRRI